MIVYFYCYCGIGILALIAAHYLQSQDQAEKEKNELRDAEDYASRVLPLPALAAVHVFANATVILLWPIVVIRSLMNGDAP